MDDQNLLDMAAAGIEHWAYVMGRESGTLTFAPHDDPEGRYEVDGYQNL
jgi:hypothetical protein